MRSPRSSISVLPGPPSTSVFFGNLLEIFKHEIGAPHEKWFAEYGPAICFRVWGGATRLATIDPKALDHILLKHSYAYPKPDFLRRILTKTLGEAILSSEVDHKRQRSLLNPAFSPEHLRAMTPMIYKVAYQLHESVVKVASGSKGNAVIDVLPWLNRATFDIIGLASFGYNFDALGKDGKRELANALLQLSRTGETIFTSGALKTNFYILKNGFPLLRLFKSEKEKVIAHSKMVINRETAKALDIARKQGENLEPPNDILSLLIQNRTSEKSQWEEMDNTELMNQLATFIFAGHETMGSTVTWCLWCLATHPQAQAKLRAELNEANKKINKATGQLSREDLNALPYLDAVFREGTRLFPIVFFTLRAASHDDQIPLSKPIRAKSGEWINHIPISAGQEMAIPILSYNRSKEVFGNNSNEFVPERWLSGEVNSPAGTGEWGGSLTFLTGPRTCIAYQLILLEAKVLLYTLITKFKFEERDQGGGPEIERRGPLVNKFFFFVFL
ncbi:cytochrome P450 monooxygenase [Phakopsora pachyrhizi]|nr:cytochrome P450 monooxygenase [Phakopsora pachyrhizi]